MLKKLFFIFLLTLVTSGWAKNDVPNWARGALWYQIVPERFRNINPKNDPLRQRIVGKDVKDWQIHPWASDWFKRQVWEKERDVPFRQLLTERRYGGDLIGVIEKLPYLKDFGAKVLYFTPVFESPSVEKYDAATLHHVDNNFGLDSVGDWEVLFSEREDPNNWTLTKADETFLELVNQAHMLEMKIVIEAVFNYCSIEFWAFQDLVEKQESSDYKDWFEILSWDDPMTPDTVEFAYNCWQGDKRFPLFRTDEENSLAAPVKQYVFDITKRWMDPNGDGDATDGIDGWSIKNADDLPGAFWQEWHALVKSLNTNTLTISDREEKGEGELNDNEFDLSFNSNLADAMKDFFFHHGADISISEFAAQLERFGDMKAIDPRHPSVNKLDDNGIGRIASQILSEKLKSSNRAGGNNGHETSISPVAPDSSHRKIQMLLTLFQLTVPGSPMVYYGDESGMWGGDYPDNTKPMLWQEFGYERESYSTVLPGLKRKCENAFDRSIFNLYRSINNVRAANAALTIGSFKTHIADDERKILVYSRQYYLSEVYVFMNLSDEKQKVSVNPGWKKNLKVVDPFSPSKYKLKKHEIVLDLEPMAARVLVKEK